jgi:CheY-like chemotaxis protein
MISGYAEMDVVVAGLKSEVLHRFFPKPFITAEFLAGVRDLARTHLGLTAGTGLARRILLVEDSIYHRTLLARLLRGRYAIHEAQDGLQGITQATTIHPDLIVTGFALLALNGLTFIRFLRAGRNLTCPVIVWEHACFLDEGIRATLRGEVDAVVEKTADYPETLLSVISGILG